MPLENEEGVKGMIEYPDDDIQMELLETLKFYVRAWRMWNTWLIACERPEIEFENFIDIGFTLVHDGYGVGQIIGHDNGLDVVIYRDTIHISFLGKPRYTWYPYVIQYGGLKDED